MKLFNRNPQSVASDYNTSPVNSSKNGWKSIGSTLAILLIAPILAVFITIFVFQSYEVFGASMETSLQDGDRLIVQKLSKSWSDIRGKVYIPQRYEIVVFDKPTTLSSVSKEVDHLIKRVIGLPGERVVVRDGRITVYNKEHVDGFNPDEGQEYAKDILSTEGEVDITISAGEVFVVGDNRDNSLDSRSFGAINGRSITGIAKIRFVPINSFERF
jgi:signal peptidase I